MASKGRFAKPKAADEHVPLGTGLRRRLLAHLGNSNMSRGISDLRWMLSKEWEVPFSSRKEDLGVLSSPRVVEAINTIVYEKGEKLEHVQTRAAKIFDELACEVWTTHVRMLALVMRKVFRQIFEGISVSAEDIEKIRAASQQGPIVIMPTHKSHFDYLVMSYVLTAYNLLIPAVCGGDNLNIPVVGSVLRRCGCFFIRRSFDEDSLYKAVFNEYVSALLKNGYPVEVFIEGARSRVGKLLKPKSGFIENLTHIVQNGEVKDILLLPVAITYDLSLIHI
eukprot:TRINITY_DN8243_c0_g2_i1.p1 TRINITY_DN8243_c0_g2~~TRINITY_DN8243_c0_g2_i1.p1  ORF type:complete len:279 (-),score=64.91 TRINITY_DN8243_c0_g2_i1:133-969(-)